MDLHNYDGTQALSSPYLLVGGSCSVKDGTMPLATKIHHILSVDIIHEHNLILHFTIQLYSPFRTRIICGSCPTNAVFSFHHLYSMRTAYTLLSQTVACWWWWTTKSWASCSTPRRRYIDEPSTWHCTQSGSSASNHRTASGNTRCAHFPSSPVFRGCRYLFIDRSLI